MVKGTIIMNRTVELLNLEKFHCCKLNVSTGEKVFYKGSEKSKGFTGIYFIDDVTFFAIYPTENGPVMYYEGKEYALNKELHITFKKDGEKREFSIEEYNIKIHYCASPYIGFDVWSNEEDIDLFYQIAEFYQDEEYYRKYTK